MSEKMPANPVKKGFLINEAQATLVRKGIRNCGGDWWINGEAYGNPRTTYGNKLYVAYNGIIKTDGLEPETICGVRPALLVEGVRPDPRKNRKLTIDGIPFIYVCMNGADAVYLCNDTITGASFEQAMEIASEFGEKAKSKKWEFGPDSDKPACLPVLTGSDFNFDGYMPDEDRICTDMSLADSNWRDYTLATRLRTYRYGDIKATWSYIGNETATVYVRQVGEEFERDYKLTVPSDLVLKYFIAYTREWADYNDPEKENDRYFNGGVMVLDLWNETVKLCSVKSYYETDEGFPERLGWNINRDELEMLDKRFRK
ncbi:MAG: hypothetical protein K6G24_14650 [Lachnospiraceae bacterium]|nr:hypothetical protein [Lachnospiraceae bacterium]